MDDENDSVGCPDLVTLSLVAQAFDAAWSITSWDGGWLEKQRGQTETAAHGH